MAELELNVRPEGAIRGSRRAENALDGVKRSAVDAEGQLARTTRSADVLGRAFRGASLAIVATATAFAARSVPAFRSQSAALAEVSTLIEGTEEEIEAIDRASRDFAAGFGGSATTQVEAFYQAISAGVGDVTDATEFLEQANILAKAGATDVTTAVNILSSAVNVYADEGLTAAEASDILFSGVKAGKTTVDELSASLGKVLPVAQSLGVGFDEVTAAVAGLTLGGISTTESVTGVRAILAAVLKPSKEAAELAEDLGIQFNAAGLEGKTFAEFMDGVITATGGSNAAIATLFGGVEAIIPAMALAGNAGDAMADTLDGMAQSAGIAQEAADKVASSLDERFGRQMSIMSNLGLTLGEILTQALVPALEFVTGAFIAMGDVADVIAVLFVGFVTAQIPALIGGLASLVTSLGLTTGAFTALGTGAGIAQIALSVLGGPIGIAFALAGAAAAAFVLLGDNTKKIEQPAFDSAVAIGQINSALETFYTSAAPSAGKAAIDVANDLVKQGEAALQAADANLALLRTELALTNAQNEGLTFNGRKPFFSDDEERIILEDMAVATEELAAAETALAAVRDRRKDVASAITGSDFVPPVPFAIVLPDTKELEEVVTRLGGVGSAAGETKQSIRELREEFVGLISSLDPSIAEALEFEAALATVNDAFAAGIIDAETYAEAIELVESAYTLAGREAKIWDEAQADLERGIVRSITQFESFRDVAASVAEALAQAYLQYALFGSGPLGSPGGGGGGILSPLFDFLNPFSNAKGNAFTGGNVIPFASGGIVNGPTTFPMSGGRTGLMGEAGPEAVVPLRKGPGGRLGIEASGGNIGPDITNVIMLGGLPELVADVMQSHAGRRIMQEEIQLSGGGSA